MICLNSRIRTHEKDNYYLPNLPYHMELSLCNPLSLAAQLMRLPAGIKLRIETHHQVCKICLRKTSGEVCGRCQQLQLIDDLRYMIRQSCTYMEDGSLLSTQGWCTPTSYPCDDVKNAESCHGNYLVYIGRFNDIFKVGITKSARGKSRRLVEQGLNEGITMGPVPGLPTALGLEQLVSDQLGIGQVITRADKAKSFSKDVDGIDDEWYRILVDLGNLDLPLGLDYHLLYNDFRIEDGMELRYPKEGGVIAGDVQWVQGDLLILHDETGWSAISARSLQLWDLDIEWRAGHT